MNDEQLAAVAAGRQMVPRNDSSAEQAFDELFHRHARRLLKLLALRAPPADVEDLHQEIWQRVWQALPTSFQGGNFRAWLNQIAVNRLIDVSRRKRPVQLKDATSFADPRCPPPEERLMAEERRSILDRCLPRLDSKLVDILRARLNGEEYASICRRSSTTPNQAYKLYQRAKRELAACVESSLGDRSADCCV